MGLLPSDKSRKVYKGSPSPLIKMNISKLIATLLTSATAACGVEGTIDLPTPVPSQEPAPSPERMKFMRMR
jgi:predicted small lipoprotein YifL